MSMASSTSAAGAIGLHSVRVAARAWAVERSSTDGPEASAATAAAGCAASKRLRATASASPTSSWPSTITAGDSSIGSPEMPQHLGAPAAHGGLDRQLAGERVVVIHDQQQRRGRAAGRRQGLGRRQVAQGLVQALDDLRQAQRVGRAEQRAGVEQAGGLPGLARGVAGFDQPQRGGQLVGVARGAAARSGIESAFEGGEGGILERRGAGGERRRVGQPHEGGRGVTGIDHRLRRREGHWGGPTRGRVAVAGRA